MKEGEERQGFAEGRAVRAWREGWQDRRGRLPGVKVQTMGARAVCWGDGAECGAEQLWSQQQKAASVCHAFWVQNAGAQLALG